MLQSSISILIFFNPTALRLRYWKRRIPTTQNRIRPILLLKRSSNVSGIMWKNTICVMTIFYASWLTGTVGRIKCCRKFHKKLSARKGRTFCLPSVNRVLNCGCFCMFPSGILPFRPSAVKKWRGYYAPFWGPITKSTLILKNSAVWFLSPVNEPGRWIKIRQTAGQEQLERMFIA